MDSRTPMTSDVPGCGRFCWLASAGGFRAMRNQLRRLVISKKGSPGGYTVDWSVVSVPACSTNALSGLMNSMTSMGKKNFVDGPVPIAFSASRY